MIRSRPYVGARRVVLAAGVAMFVFVSWASFARVDEVTRGQGRVIPSSKAQVVQSAEPATIRDIVVRPGQAVRKGQLLVRLDDTESSAQLGQIEAENRSLAARADRLSREGTGGAGGTDCANDPSAQCSEEAALQSVRAAALRSRKAALGAAIEQRRRDYAEAQATVGSLQSSLKIAQDQVAMIAPLAAQSIVPKTELMDAQREVTELQGKLAAAQQAASRSQAAISEAQAQSAEAGLQFRQEALNERSQLVAKMAVNSESLRGAAGRLQRSEIRSPVNGIVNDVQVTTVGGFVQAGQKIMQVVPLGDKLLVEARVSPKDIAFIKVGDRANVKVTAYDFAVYGGLTGKVVQISADSIYDEAARESYFGVVVQTDRAFLQSGKRRLPISPGMICDVEIVTGMKSVLSYLLKPLIRARSEALSER
ncbi:MAG: HlyD family type I secretion periplasmic adaptor subunit [Sphingomonadales bacterium]|jgi:adhesin transport system membrane fusion protein|nr:HlyD family type I secretion periplasmic adaptor subunit [Sphingomonadales bacterium]MBK9003023.1 HlyD family type I secretion periplasmic adaptor subunit [Sphingomonadales bacterium]MBK9268270.1 HlyD family type I secretion periplasmic adaptor subunit [Sphingomonadales bacterium]MBP6433987.1 HlyD family type I secretion periplasmic adaptor subunit [Sphingorhabdus sp.]